MNSAFGASLLAYWQGNLKTKHIIERNDGFKREIAVEYLFKKPSDWDEEEVRSLNHIPLNSTILDIGCGVGRIATYIQNKGNKVVGVDSCQEAIQIAKARGLQFTFLGNICDLNDPPVFNSFNVILMMGNNFGICGDTLKTEMLLKKLFTFLSSDGLLIFSCLDPLNTNNPLHIAYHKQNKRKNKPPGLVHIRICYKKFKDPWWDLLLVDIPTTEKLLENTGYQKIAIYQNDTSPVYFVVAKKCKDAG